MSDQTIFRSPSGHGVLVLGEAHPTIPGLHLTATRTARTPKGELT